MEPAKVGEEEGNNMREIVKSFELGQYVGFKVEAPSETEFFNELINRIIEAADIEFCEDVLDQEAERVERELRSGLSKNMKSVGAYCYVNGIEESQLRQHCRDMLKRTAAENLAISTIAANEGLEVTDKDLSAYKTAYREQYARALLSEPESTDEELSQAILVKKVLRFLMKNNMQG